MAKKKESLSPEARLQEALVPESEQPYPIPENWCWTKLWVLLQISKEKTEDFSQAGLKYIGLEHLQKNRGIVTYGAVDDVKSLKNVFHSQQILYGRLRPYLNKHDVAPFDGICSTDILVFSTTSSTIPKFVNLFLDQDEFIEYAVSNSRGINLPRVTEKALLEAKTPLPPLSEQQRIVERIESMFVKLDEAKENAQSVIKQIDVTKKSILARAFHGELGTNDPSEERASLVSDCEQLYPVPDNWCFVSLGSVTSIIMGQSPSGDSTTTDSQYMPLIGGAADIGDEYPKATRYTTAPTKVSAPDDLIVCIRATLGKPVYADKRYCLGRGVAAIRPIIGQSAFYKYFFNAFEDYLYDNATGSTFAQISSQKLQNMPVPFPPLTEQQRIVERIESLFAKLDESNKKAQDVLQQIDIIKKSILARAFRGELGTNDPSEESAVELLKQVLSERQYGVLLVLQVKRVGISVGECLIKHSRLNGL